MKAFLLGAAVTLAFSTVANAQAPSWTVSAESQRCPSKWGAADERGSVNHQKPAAVMNAAKLIKTGEVIELAHVLGPSMAFFGTRRFDMHTKRTFMNQFSNMRGSNEEIIITELGQVGNAVRRICAPDPSQQLVQLPEGGRKRRSHRLQEVRRP
jgi:hypothetical protein